MINSRNKGACGEREFRDVLKKHSFDARRGQQYAGGGDSPDVVCPELADEFHFEVKRVEAGNLYKWLAQAIRDAEGIQIPVVAHRRSREEWVAILPMDDFLALVTRTRNQNGD